MTAGDTDRQVLDYVVSRYGEFVLLRPRLSARNALLWGGPFLLLVGGGMFAYLAIRRSRRQEVPALSAEEDAALRRILDDQI